MKEKEQYSLEFFDKFFQKKEVRKTISKEEYNKFKKEFVKYYPKFIQGFKKRYEYWMEVIYKTIYDPERCKERGFTFDKFFHYYIKLHDIESILKDFDLVTNLNYEPTKDKYWEIIYDSAESIKKHLKNWARIGAFYTDEMPTLILSEGERFKCFPIIENEKGEIVKRDEEKFGCDKIIEILTGKNPHIYDDDSRNHLNEYWQQDVAEALIKKIFIEMNEMIPDTLKEYGHFGFNSGFHDSSIVAGFCVKFFVSNEDPKLSKEDTQENNNINNKKLKNKLSNYYHESNEFDEIANEFLQKMRNFIKNDGIKNHFYQLLQNFIKNKFNEKNLNQLNKYLISIKEKPLDFKSLFELFKNFYDKHYMFVNEKIIKDVLTTIKSYGLKDIIGESITEDINSDILDAIDRNNINPYNAPWAIPIATYKDFRKSKFYDVETFYKNEICKFSNKKPGFFSTKPPKIKFNELEGNEDLWRELGKVIYQYASLESTLDGVFLYYYHVCTTKEEIKYFESQVESWESYEYSYEDGTTFHHFHSKNGFDIIKDNFVKIMKNVINDEKLEKAYLSFIKNVYVNNFPYKEFLAYMQKNNINIGKVLNENTLKNKLLAEFKMNFQRITIDEISKRMNEIKLFDPKKIKYFSMNYHSHSKNPSDLDKLIKKTISGFSADNKIFVFELYSLKQMNIEELILKAFKLDKYKNKLFNKPPKLKMFSANNRVALKALWEYENNHTDLNKYGYFFEKDSKFYFVFQHIVFDEYVFTNEEIEIKYSWDDIKDTQFISKEDVNFFNILKAASKTHNEFSKIKKEKVYRCPVCKKVKYNSSKLLYNHIIREHNNDIPENMPVEQFVFNLNNKKTHGTCVICGKETQWNPKTNKYHRLCSEACKQKYIQMARDRLLQTHGTDDLSKDPEHQKKMLNNRKISSVYTFSDGTKVSTNSSYEKDFLQFNENHFHFTGKDIISCDIIFYYEFENKKHFYMPDFYIPDLNLIIEVKEKGSNASFIPRMRQMDLLKIEAVIKSEKYNFITVCGKEYDKYVELVEYLKEQENLNSEEKKLIIEIDKENYGSALVPQKFVM